MSSLLIEGIAAAPGRALGPARWLNWEIPPVPHRTVPAGEVEAEVARFDEARAWALGRIGELIEQTTERLGAVEAKVFESQAMMIEDPEVVEGTIAYIRENSLSAERAFDWRLLEFRVRFLESTHAMLQDRLVDLHDVRSRILSRLLGQPEPRAAVAAGEEPGIIVALEVTPSAAAEFDARQVLGFVSARGSRGSHSVLLARSLGIPAIVGVGPRLREIPDGATLLVDGATGRVAVDPAPETVERFQRASADIRLRRERLDRRATEPTRTKDGVSIVLRANLDQPEDVDQALRVGARGVGLFRSEFLVIGRRTIPDEEEQFEAYRRVAEAFPDDPVTLRTFDIGGDKFPLFLQMPPEENPYLGWRAIRVCLDLPDLFRNQLRAAARVADGGGLQVLIPFVTSVDEVVATRDLLREVGGAGVRLGVMVETPAAVETVDLLAPHADFLSLGTNDLTQYVLAADRGNARLAGIYDPLHPALLRMYRRLVQRAAEHGLDVTVCGELGGEAVGVFALIGLGYRTFSLAPSGIPEIGEMIRAMSAARAKDLMNGLLDASGGQEARARIHGHLAEAGAVPVGAGELPAP